jgi:uncharacterized protein (DUF1800 family)
VRSLGEKPNFQIGKVEFKIDQHDFGAKEFLGQQIPAAPAGLTSDERDRIGRHELERVLEIVTRHPSTAQHIATKLCRHFVADEPPAHAVTRVADVFGRTGGDIPETLRALFDTDEFREQRGNKFKRPFNFVVSALRVTGARTDASLEIIDYLRRMGNAPFNYPTPEGYPDKATPWMGTLLWRWNFAVALSENRIKGTRVDFETLRANAGGDQGLMSHLLGRKATVDEAQAYRDSGAGLALLLASPAFQRC